MQRIKSIVGSYIQKELVIIGEDTSFVKISGYVSLPSAAVKSKKEQYFFVNNRFVRNPFLNHAIYEAYKELISYQSHPRYFIFLELDPKHIDINIHPTKTEVKFTDDKTVYMLLVSAIKRALGKANVSPSIDFEIEPGFNSSSLATEKSYLAPKINYNTNYNPFNSSAQNSTESGLQKMNKQHWENLYEGFKNNVEITEITAGSNQQIMEVIKKESVDFNVFQLNFKYVVTAYDQNVLIIDQQRAHERILYEHYLNSKKEYSINTQQILFPEQMELSANDFILIKSLLPEFKLLGFDVEIFGKNSIVINGTPNDLPENNLSQTIEGILETYKLNTIDAKIEKHDNLCRAIAKNSSIKYGKILENSEMKSLLNSLFGCENPLYTANGKVILMEVDYKEVEKYFKN